MISAYTSHSDSDTRLPGTECTGTVHCHGDSLSGVGLRVGLFGCSESAWQPGRGDARAWNFNGIHWHGCDTTPGPTVTVTSESESRASALAGADSELETEAMG